MRHSGDFRAVGSFQMYKRPRVLTLASPKRSRDQSEVCVALLGSHVEIVMDHTQSGDNRFPRSVWQFSQATTDCVTKSSATKSIATYAPSSFR
jgi:hypothetical protein